MKNVQVATGDSKKDEDAEINRDYGTNSSRLAPAKSPRLNGQINGRSAFIRQYVHVLSAAFKIREP